MVATIMHFADGDSVSQMYGRYSELQRFAREFAAARRPKPQRPNIEEARKKMKKTYSQYIHVQECNVSLLRSIQ